MNGTNQNNTRVLLVDDENLFRNALKKQLIVRGYKVLDVDNGEDAIKVARHDKPEVIILDQKMPGMDGIQTLKEIKKIRPEIQVIMLTGHGSTQTAVAGGKHDVFYYMQKPCSIEKLIEAIEAAREERVFAMERHEIPELKRNSLKDWLIGSQNRRPGFILLGLLLLLFIVLLPPSEKLISILSEPKIGSDDYLIMGYSSYAKMKKDQTISQYYSQHTGFYQDSQTKQPLSPKNVALRAKVMIGVLVIAVIFWATGAVPIGITALMVGVLMYFFQVLPPDKVATAYAKDAVIFIFGVLAISSAISKTGLDRRIGLLLLGTSSSLKRFIFIFPPLLAMTASFLSEHALVAFIIPILMLGYIGILRSYGMKQDRNLVIMMILLVCFTANVGGPGSPAAGGRNAVMLGILSDYGIHPTFGNWVMYGLPFVPVCAFLIALYFYFAFRKKIKVKEFDVISAIRKESEKIGKMTRDEYITAFILVTLILLWTTMSDVFGMGGPVILCIVALNIFGVLRWKDINSIHWEVVALYASACAMGYGLAITGAALLIADGFISIIPPVLKSGVGLCISTSFFTGILTNFMSDGATVAAIGPLVLPMAIMSDTPRLMVGLSTAFASSFAHTMIIGTPNNAIAYSLAKDPETGEQLVSLKDFMVHGLAALVISFLVLWFWTFLGYWQWIGF